MARLLRLLPDSASPHEPRSVEPSRIARVSLAAVANQAKPFCGVAPSRQSKFPGGGRSWFTNRALAHVRTPGGPTSRTQQLFRVARTSPNLCARPSLTRSNRRGTGPVCPVVWEGGRREASPYPDHAQIADIRRRLGERGKSSKADIQGPPPRYRSNGPRVAIHAGAAAARRSALK